MVQSGNDLVDAIMKRRGLSHFLFWAISLLLLTLVSGASYGAYHKTFVKNAMMLVPQMVASYTLVYYLVPKLLLKRKYFLFLFLFLMVAYVLSAAARIIVIHVIEVLYRTPPFLKESIYEILTDLRQLINPNFYRVFSMAFVMLVIKLLTENLKEKHRVEQLEKKKAIAELNFLKAQIQPHFLFNTLNNIYALALKKSNQAPDAILKLSKILDYVIYQSEDSLVPIKKELDFIYDYIDLEKLRYGDRLSLDFNKHIDDTSTPITPLLLISLVENAFKHGASNSIKNPEITIDLTLKNKHLVFSVFNTISNGIKNKYAEGEKSIGLTNLKGQLNLVYLNKHDLNIKRHKNSFEVSLAIDLS